jgi:hypothetical protein
METEHVRPAERELDTVVARDSDVHPTCVLEGTGYRSLVLTVNRSGTPAVVGAFAVAQGRETMAPVSDAFLRAIAHGIYDAGDVQTVYLKAAPGL